MIRNVAITGGARGIGRATAEACLAVGMNVAIGDVDAAAFAGFLDRAEEAFGPLDAVVNNAGIAPIGLFADEDPAETQRLVEINLGGVLTGTRLALQRFLPRRQGHIVNLASSAGQIATAGGATYAATKHGVVGFTRAIRAEIRGTGVRTTIVLPGLIRTDMIAGFAKARGTRVIGPDKVAAGIVAALRTGREEVFVPRELGPVARLVAGTPPAIADRIKAVLRADRVMVDADMGARASSRGRMDATVRADL